MSDATNQVDMNELSAILAGNELAAPAPTETVKMDGADVPVVQETTEEAPVAEEPAKAPEENKFAHKFSALAKKEQKLVEAQRALRAQEERIREEAARTAKLAAAMEKLSTDPIGALEALGVDPGSLYADMTEQSLTGALKRKEAPSKSDVDVKAEIEALRRELYAHELEKERAMGQLQAREVVSSDPERWAYVQANGAESEVWNVIEMYHEQHGKVLDFEEAADMVESYLESEAQKFIEATARKKNRAAQQQPAQQAAPAKTQQVSTLSNNMSLKAPPSAEDDWERTVVDPEERKARLLRELETLKF